MTCLPSSFNDRIMLPFLKDLIFTKLLYAKSCQNQKLAKPSKFTVSMSKHRKFLHLSHMRKHHINDHAEVRGINSQPSFAGLTLAHNWL